MRSIQLNHEIPKIKSHKIQLFKKGQYSNSTGAAYQDLISFAGVSANNVDKVVDTVLTQIAGIQVDELPKSTFPKEWQQNEGDGTIPDSLRALSRKLYQYDTSL